MPLKRNHLDGLRLANFAFTEDYLVNDKYKFITVKKEEVVDLINFLQDNFIEDRPFIPLKLTANTGEDIYLFYIHDLTDDKI